MKLKSQVYTAVSGSVGGLTYAHNRGGMYTRARAIPTNPNSTAQQTVRMYFGIAATRWRDVLTAAQRLAWENYAANSPVTDVFGDPIILSGQQMYVRCNTVRMRGGASWVDDGPVVFGLASLDAIAIQPNSATPLINVAFDDTQAWLDDDDTGCVIQTSRFVSPSINFLRSPFRYITTIEGSSTTPESSPYSLGTASAFGEPVASAQGLKIFGRATLFLADGRISNVVQMESIVA